MRVLSVAFAFLFLAAGAVAQGPSHEPVGRLAHVMRGILFPNSNIVFDVQTTDPDAPKTEEGGPARQPDLLISTRAGRLSRTPP